MPYTVIKFFIVASIAFCLGCDDTSNKIPELILGTHQDDYKIEYELSKDIFVQKPNTRFHIIKWNIEEEYFIAQNDSLNPYDPNLYSRIDWITLTGMEPFTWGFCLSAFDAPNADSAEAVNVADRSIPKTGCDGYPFSRMKPITK